MEKIEEITENSLIYFIRPQSDISNSKSNKKKKGRFLRTEKVCDM